MATATTTTLSESLTAYRNISTKNASTMTAPNPTNRAHAFDSMMPVSRSQSLLASLPSVMSVVGENNTTTTTTLHKKRPSSSSQPFSPAFRRDSVSTYDSVDSSPTTTVSTVESSLTEPSPTSSPESPKSNHLPPFKTFRTNSYPTIMEKEQFSSSFPLLPGIERQESPNKKMRNTKNLSVNTLASNRSSSQLSRLASSGASSAPPTPAFIVPPKAPRRQPSNLGLTITTPESTASIDSERPPIPQTPSDPQIRTLRLNGPLFSPTHAPEGGMRLPPLASAGSTTSRFGKSSRPPLSVSPLSSFDTSDPSPITKQTLDHVQEETDYDPPLSQEVKSPAYPQGPICIYDPNIYLYLEPTQIEARAFDVVINVAREVNNPFHTDPSTSNPSRPDPEYIHIPWDHNANVVDDLLRLCQTIDDRVRQEKRVLIHCQCGVSRSASLVVAYGIYKNPQLTVQEAYDAVKNKSRWIGPNMNLIYQLSEFKGKIGSRTTPSWHTWRTSIDPPTKTHSAPSNLDGPSTGRSGSFGSSFLSVEAPTGDITPGPSSAPPNIHWPEKASIATPLVRPSTSDDLEMDLSLSPLTVESQQPPPAGAIAADLKEVANDLEAKAADSKPVVEPILPAGFSSLLSRRQHRQNNVPRFAFPEVSAPSFGSILSDAVPPTPSILSPRAAEFTASPFHRTSAGDLAGSSVFEQGLMSPRAVDEDPRSPHQMGEAPITRGIFDILNS